MVFRIGSTVHISGILRLYYTWHILIITEFIYHLFWLNCGPCRVISTGSLGNWDFAGLFFGVHSASKR